MENDTHKTQTIPSLNAKGPGASWLAVVEKTLEVFEKVNVPVPFDPAVSSTRRNMQMFMAVLLMTPPKWKQAKRL